jgi:mono/diheme cytochrome c family protein
MKYWASLKVCAWILCSVLCITGCAKKPLEAPEPPVIIQKVADNWDVDQAQRNAHKAQYIQTNQTAFDWFADFAFSETDGTPFIALRLLAVIAPELWGSEDNFLDVVGLFNDTRKQGYPMPSGIGISALARENPTGSIDYTSFTCAACHIGRVVTDTGETLYVDGGVNTEFNIVLYRVKVYQTLQKIIGNETDKTQQQALLVDAFLTALEKSQASSDTFFYRGYKNDWVNFDAAYEKAQIALFIGRAAELIGAFSSRAIADYTGYGALLDKNYKGFQERSLEGFPGMADATGIFTVNAYNDAQNNFFTRLFASFILPSSPGITDFMSVWEQDKRKAEWDKPHKTLINGGGQWNGNIPIPMYRNLAAQMTLGLADNDIRVSAFGVDLLDKLPETVYPFNVDVDLAKQGEHLFAKNCAQCHQPHNGKVYDNLNVNLDRSKVVSWLIRRGGISSFNATCSPATTVVMEDVATNPCATFDGVSLEGKKDLIMSPNGQHHGYNARPLSGIWAQAPYLHNGSVPTAYHLLVPSERPKSFYKSRLEYDQKYLGYAWTAPEATAIASEHSYLFDSASFSAFSNAGHDTDIEENGQRYKLDWSNDKAGAMAIIEYLKTL